MNFQFKLDTAVRLNQSLLCVGLDPWPPQMPIKDIALFNRNIIEATSDLVCAYKPNFAFYEAEGLPGLRALEKTISSIPSNIPIILDGKRGDIGNTAKAYAKAIFEQWGADATTINPYGGQDAVEPFLNYRDHGIFVWCKSSNPGAKEIQSLTLGDGDTVFEKIAKLSNQWNVYGNVGLVMGATYPQELAKAREICPDMPILIPGIGQQGGQIGTTLKAGVGERGASAIISVSRQIIYASRNNDYPNAARTIAQDLRQQIQNELVNYTQK